MKNNHKNIVWVNLVVDLKKSILHINLLHDLELSHPLYLEFCSEVYAGDIIPEISICTTLN